MSEHIAMVTGGGGGIGSAISRALAEEDAFVLVAGRNQARCIEVAESIRAKGGEAAALTLDVTDERSIEQALSEAVRLAGAADWLVNNAGFVESAPLLASDLEHDPYRRHMDVNFHGARRLAEKLLPAMLARRYGRIVQIASSAALRGYGYVSAYAASKHALLGYTRAAAIELAPKGVALGAICPHYVDSPMTDASVRRIFEQTGRAEKEVRKYFARQNPGGVLVTPEEVAEAARTLIHSNRTGTVLELIGGAWRTVEEGEALKAPAAR